MEEKVEIIKETINDMINPAMSMHMGSVSLYEANFDDDPPVVKLIFEGMCSSCPSSFSSTLIGITATLREETKISDLDTKTITVTEVRMSPDLKTAKIFVIPLGGKNTENVISKLKEFSFVIRKVLSKKIMVKFMPKLFFVNDDSFDYAEKIENLIRQTQK